MVATPSPAPGVDDSPFMTWGDIQGTPLRLDMEETPVDIGGWGGDAGVAGRFHITQPKAREDVLRRLTIGSISTGLGGSAAMRGVKGMNKGGQGGSGGVGGGTPGRKVVTPGARGRRRERRSRGLGWDSQARTPGGRRTPGTPLSGARISAAAHAAAVRPAGRGAERRGWAAVAAAG